MAQVTLKVNGMSCNHCVNAVETSVGKLNGVREVTVLLNEGLVDIEFEDGAVNVEQLIETIEDQGYDVVRS
ncbi:copper chaperone CopZ [Thermoactinomyces sp. CICC 10523]|uniref:copper chaperone CopZ n=1 Tax=Thermoactinomyces sp. CICC 10523 TaxID=2767428 RepID=UPI0018DBAA4B|nr:copper chaperone CopZ [Thermoactinomyces sp. CICC 10523]MBH8597663.1 copper chaperone CopZ [Thermoactinomyces sp. CICC 10523]